ncbi:hypothetical protein CP082626L3_0446A, partial [Chlamydia psittaci 08-2626_L3]
MSQAFFNFICKYCEGFINLLVW